MPVQVIEALAHKLTSYGKRAVVNAHGGLMNGSGFYTAYATVMLNALLGNLNAPGGTYVKGEPFQSAGEGPRYDLAGFPGKVGPQGMFLSRSRNVPYEQSSEYRRKIDAGENPYPARAPWYPLSPPLFTEHLCSALEGYPYQAKIWINHMGNPIYGQAGLQAAIDERLRDTSRIGLIIGVKPFINETNAYADYIIPDVMTYRRKGFDGLSRRKAAHDQCVLATYRAAGGENRGRRTDQHGGVHHRRVEEARPAGLRRGRHSRCQRQPSRARLRCGPVSARRGQHGF